MAKVYKVFDLERGFCKTFKTKKGAEKFLNKLIINLSEQGYDIRNVYMKESTQEI